MVGTAGGEMITVIIKINEREAYRVSAVNIGLDSEDTGEHRYRLDTGEEICHHRKDGAIQLAKHMLEAVLETGEIPGRRRRV